jgi:hypothetical protein
MAGRNPVKDSPFGRLAFRGRKVNPGEGEAGVLVVPPALVVLAVDDARLVGVKQQAHLCHPPGDGSQHLLGLFLAHAVHDSIVGVALEGNPRVVPGHPAIERKVHEQVGQNR